MTRHQVGRGRRRRSHTGARLVGTAYGVRALPRGRALALVVALGLAGCSRGAPPEPAEAGAARAATPALDTAVFVVAADLRDSARVPASALASRSDAERRLAARSYARIADEGAEAELVKLLADADPEVVSWAAYGLGYTCKGHEDAHVKALVARAASLEAAGAASSSAGLSPRGVFAPPIALARAVGRCATPLAEDALVSWLSARSVYSTPAALGLGDLAVRRKSLRPATVAALVAAAPLPGMDVVFHPLSRVTHGPKEAPAVLTAARAALARPSDERVLVVKTLAKLGPAGASELGAVASATTRYTAAERAEAARGLARLDDAGQGAAAAALLNLVPDQDAAFIASLRGPQIGVLLALIDALGEVSPARAHPVLSALMRLERPAGSKSDPLLSRRIDELRCASALTLALAGYDVSGLVRCAEPGSFVQQRATLKAVLRRPLHGGRKVAFMALARSPHLRVREAAIEALGTHPEVGDAGRELLGEALASDKAGLVATAADVVVAHPERTMVLAARERHAALDPRAPPPSATPAKELDPALAKAIEGALARAWPADRFETRLSLMEAAVAVGHPLAAKVATEACASPNVTMRERAEKALRSLGQARACPGRPGASAGDAGVAGATVSAVRSAAGAAGEAGEAGGHVAVAAEGVTVTLVFEAGEIVLRLEPELSPVTVAHVAALARAGFYKGIVAHRVVPGFVLQFGDPDGDGYGGAGVPLRCETSPAPFAALDVGMALAGRDTGSSQLFITLSRTPHLDGEYTRIGRAAGAVDGVAEGDVVIDARVSGP